jgi:SAM-dependent methyltransferase
MELSQQPIFSITDKRSATLQWNDTPSPEQIREHYAGHAYIAYQAPRFSMLLGMLKRYVGPESRILDIGRTVLTHMASAIFKRPVDSLGFEPDAEIDGARHYQFDLNAAQNPEQWRKDTPRYDVIIFAEVVEHLHTAPSLVVGFLKSLLNPGGVLIAQTPNGTAIGRRLKLLAGKNPYERIREDATNPGHFREYTADELLDYGRKLGLEIAELQAGHWIDLRFKFDVLSRPDQSRPVATRHGLGYKLHSSGLTNLFYRLLPGSMRTGLTIVYRRAE